MFNSKLIIHLIIHALKFVACESACKILKLTSPQTSRDAKTRHHPYHPVTYAILKISIFILE